MTSPNPDQPQSNSQAQNCQSDQPTGTPASVNGDAESAAKEIVRLLDQSGLMFEAKRWCVENTVDLIEPDHRTRAEAPYREAASRPLRLLEKPETKDTPAGQACAALLACLDAHRQPTGMGRTELMHYLLDELHGPGPEASWPENEPAIGYTSVQLEALFARGFGDVPVTQPYLAFVAVNAGEAWQRMLIAMRRIGEQVQHRNIEWHGWDSIPWSEDVVRDCAEMPLWDILNDAVRSAAIAAHLAMAMHESLAASQTQLEASK